MLWQCLELELGEEMAFGLAKPGLVATAMLDASLAAPRDDFPAGEVYEAMQRRGEVVDSRTVAAFCRFLLRETSVGEFRGSIWDIREPAHHARWLAGPLYL